MEYDLIFIKECVMNVLEDFAENTITGYRGISVSTSMHSQPYDEIKVFCLRLRSTIRY